MNSTVGFSDGPQREPEPSQVWLGATVDHDAILATTDAVQLSIGAFLVYPTAWSFTLSLGRDPFATGWQEPVFFGPPGRPTEGAFRFGLEFADGTRVIASPYGGPGVVSPGEGRSESMGERLTYTVMRPPESGPVTFVFEWTAAGIAEFSWVLPGGVLETAAASCKPIWDV